MRYYLVIREMRYWDLIGGTAWMNIENFAERSQLVTRDHIVYVYMKGPG